ncbi:MAG: DUF3604 domain-containing protein [Planctomycetota bacterium]|nr:MAG: DUF3604 domain-containing protein [Planctomycetota bacterium]
MRPAAKLQSPASSAARCARLNSNSLSNRRRQFMLVASQVAPGKPEILHFPDVPDDERRQRHGTGTHTNIGTLTVSEATTVDFDFVVGSEPVATGGELLIVWRWPFDWSDLQAEDPAGDGFMRADFFPAAGRSASDVELGLRYNWIAGIEPWHHQIQIRVRRGELRQGDRVTLTCGDRSQGGGGWRAPTCAAARCRFLMLIDHQGKNRRARLVQEPSFRIVAGSPAGLTILAPSDAVANEPIELIVRADDEWGNPTEPPASPQIRIDGETVRDIEVLSTESSGRTIRLHVRVPSAGVSCLRAEAGPLAAVSNPVRVHASLPEQQIFWGDLHSGQTEIGCGNGSLAEHYAFARDCAGLQFITHQANDHYVTRDDWEHTRQVTEEFYEPGRYVTFLGCEWSPLTKDGGDRNVFYRSDEPVLRRSDRFFREAEPDPSPDARTAPEFHEAFRDLDVLVNIHVGGRMTNLQWYDQRIERLCETHSTHGTVEWFFMDALQRGCRVGLTAGTDGVMGRPGACHPGRRLIRNLRNGLTAVYATELTREAIWQALQHRRCYATTGERIRLRFEVNGSPMGSEITTDDPPRVDFEIVGTCAVERVDLFRGTKCLKTWQVAPPVAFDTERRLRLLWGGTERKGTARLQRVDWDGSLTIEQGGLTLIETVNFQSIADSARSTAPDRIEWSSKTAGNMAGIVVALDGGNSAALHFQTGPKSISFSVSDLMGGELTWDAGGVNRIVRLGIPPAADGPREFQQSFIDKEPPAGTTPYWIRVVQIDQSMAWSSPVYVTRS